MAKRKLDLDYVTIRDTARKFLYLEGKELQKFLNMLSIKPFRFANKRLGIVCKPR